MELNLRTTKRKAEALSNGVFLICLAVLFYTGFWWPGILLAIWLMLVVRQYLTGRMYDLAISSAILLSLFVINYFNINWTLLMPALFIIGGVYIIFREYYYTEE